MTAKLEDLIDALTGDGGRDAADAMLGVLLAASDIWESPRTSDGVSSCRVLHADEDSVRACGKVWEISQVLERYCFELVRADDQIHWTVHYGAPTKGPRRHRAVDLIDATDDPRTLAWRISASGLARVSGRDLVDVRCSIVEALNV